ncbi:uncharacterized protein LOC110831758 [Zootermopsis nevadensis]|uniref:Uncharacterized protein n=1 Tax=Zootermopsis nevadensis TaxID=136037 RepID=A0A067RJD2_ZOONE|nr:uncharacterized protein LOC110831758 [Zootermopsis nevadensis]KDR23927.1 hypothetical protein L798_10800 [Zootermopsis nevadensis]
MDLHGIAVALFLCVYSFVVCDVIVEAQTVSPLASDRRPYDCPLCDSSVFSYCSDKLLHDACCCLKPHELPYQCNYADCSFLHANSCREHRLITACCCNRLIFHYKCEWVQDRGCTNSFWP